MTRNSMASVCQAEWDRTRDKLQEGADVSVMSLQTYNMSPRKASSTENSRSIA